MGSGACARGFRTPRSRESWREASRPIMTPRVNVPYTFPRRWRSRHGKEVGHQGFKTPQWSAVRRDRSGRIGPVLLARARTLCAVTALCSLFGGSKSKIKSKLAREFRSENGEACPGEVEAGSPSGMHHEKGLARSNNRKDGEQWRDRRALRPCPGSNQTETERQTRDASHPEHAELRVLDRRIQRRGKSQSQHAPRLRRQNDPVIPQPRSP